MVDELRQDTRSSKEIRGVDYFKQLAAEVSPILDKITGHEFLGMHGRNWYGAGEDSGMIHFEKDAGAKFIDRSKPEGEQEYVVPMIDIEKLYRFIQGYFKKTEDGKLYKPDLEPKGIAKYYIEKGIEDWQKEIPAEDIDRFKEDLKYWEMQEGLRPSERHGKDLIKR